MCSYNRINGVYSAANHDLLTGTLIEDWGFDGLAMSDWGAVHETLGTAKSGLDLEMPGGYWMTAEKLMPFITSGEITQASIDEHVRRILRHGRGRRIPGYFRSPLLTSKSGATICSTL